MYCPNCKSEYSKIIDSRFSKRMNATRRRHECEECGSRFTRYEIVSGDFDKIRDIIREDLKASYIRILKNRVINALAYDIDDTDIVSEIYREVEEHDA